MTDREWKAAQQYLPFIAEAAGQYDLDPAILLGIGSRESHWGLSKYLDTPGPAGTGDFARRSWGRHGELPPDGRGWGRGLMQIDYAAHEFARTGPWQDPRENILYGARVLSSAISYMEKKGLEMPLCLRAGIAAYNRGPGNIWRDLKQGLDVDARTAKGNYAADSLRRSDWYRERLWELKADRMALRAGPRRLTPAPLASLPDRIREKWRHLGMS